MELFGVALNSDGTIRVVSVPVVKETAKSYFVERPNYEIWSAFGMTFSNRYSKDDPSVFTSARAAVAGYMKQRQAEKASALTAAGHATKLIALANEILMHLPELPPVDDAVARGSASEHDPTTRV